jgi:hypothetical protein
MKATHRSPNPPKQPWAALNLAPIEKVSGLTRRDFEEEYLKKNKPVVFTDLVADWPATDKWTFDWLRTHHGHIRVPVFDNDFRKPGKNYLVPKRTMPFGEYLDTIEAGPTDLRMFLFNIFKYVPEMVHDFSMPDITDGWLKAYPMMFFGGEGARVDLHYDLDCATVFITQFQKRKKVILFAPDQADYLYQHPFTVQSELRLDQPDLEKYPALKKAQGLETTLYHGETLFMPHLYWHFIYYLDGGFSLSLRRHNWYTRGRGAYNIARHLILDKGMNYMLGEKWETYKSKLAQKRAQSVLARVFQPE